MGNIKSGGRKEEIVTEYLTELNKHIDELRKGTAEDTLEISDFARLLHIHPRHLSNTIQEVLRRSPCDIYEEKLLQVAKELLLTSTSSIADIARSMNYDPSNFTKFFKHYAGITPGQYRNSRLAAKN